MVGRKVSEQVQLNVPVVEALTQELTARRIDCLMIDPFVSSDSVPENDNNAIESVARTFAAIAERSREHTRDEQGIDTARR